MSIYLSSLPEDRLLKGTDRILNEVQEGSYLKKWLSRNVAVLSERVEKGVGEEGLKKRIRLFQALLLKAEKEDFSDISLHTGSRGDLIVSKKGEDEKFSATDAVVTMYLNKGQIYSFKARKKLLGGTRLTFDLSTSENECRTWISVSDGETDITRRISLAPPYKIDVKKIAGIAAAVLAALSFVLYKFYFSEMIFGSE